MMNAKEVAYEFGYGRFKGKWVSEEYIRFWDYTDYPFGTKVYISDGMWIYPSGATWDEKGSKREEDVIKHPLSAKELKEMYKEEILDMMEEEL
jgi:hypothetical protein